MQSGQSGKRRNKLLLRAKTTGLLQVGKITEKQQKNTELNQKEMAEGKCILESKPQRLVLELTNACNLRCIMCGRDEANFNLTTFDIDILKNLAPLLDEVEEVTLFGWGEPTLHPQFEEILAFLDNYPVKKYFVTNGMRLDKIKDSLFKYHVDIMAISLDGANAETNNTIRVNSDLDFIVKQLKDIVRIKNERGLKYPYMNFVMTMFDRNIEELPALVKLASDIGLDEVKGVYLTVFSENLLSETLYNQKDKVRRIFEKTEQLGEQLGIKIKLPYLQDEDIAGSNYHKDCFVAWRDFFFCSFGYVRPCQSNAEKFFKYDKNIPFESMWNSKEYQDFRNSVNKETMCDECKRCYQSSHANWNNKTSFIQTGEEFAPTWEK